MSVIQKIRTKYAKLAGGIIALALVAFILMDALSSRTSSLFGNDTSVVKVDGEAVDIRAYNQRVQEYEVLYSNQTIDDNFRAQINEMAMQDLIKEQLVAEQAEKLGMTVTEDEKKDMIYGTDPDMMVKNYQAFTDPNTKAFNQQYVKLFEEQAMQLDPTGKALQHWQTYKGYIQANALTKKFNAAFTAAMYVPKFMVETKTKEFAQMASIDFVSVPFETIKDEEVKIDDADYKAYMNKHAGEYTIKEDTRSIEYVAFRVIPSADDTARALGALQNLKEEFTTTNDNESFVNRNSENPFVDRFIMKSSFKSMYADSIFSLPIGGVLGPIYESETYSLVKMLDKTSAPDSVMCRHILIKTAENGQEVLADSIAKTRIDSIAAAIKAGTPFYEMVQKYSDDGGSKDKAGEYNFSYDQKAGLVKEFGDFVFEGKPGESKIVKAEGGNYAGYHYIEIMKQGEVKTAVKIALISKGLFPGDETENNVYSAANEFAANSSTAEAFDKSVKDNNVQKLVAENVKVSDFTIYGIGPSREVIRWMYDAKVNDVSPVFSMNGKYIVAKLTKITPKGMMPLDETMKKNLEFQVKADKKSELIKKKFDGKNLSEIAAAVTTQVQQLDSFRGNNSFSGPLGYAPKVVGYSFCPDFKPGSVSKGIAEQQGVYYILLKNRFEKPEADNTTFMQSERQMMMMQARSGINTQVMEQLKKNAGVKYNGNNF